MEIVQAEVKTLTRNIIARLRVHVPEHALVLLKPGVR